MLIGKTVQSTNQVVHLNSAPAYPVRDDQLMNYVNVFHFKKMRLVAHLYT